VESTDRMIPGMYAEDRPYHLESPFALAVRLELEKARGKFPKINSLHEGYAVILEEVDEVWQEIKKNQAVRSNDRVCAELIQIGAMCQRLAEDCKIV
jgi:hypothetical protein